MDSKPLPMSGSPMPALHLDPHSGWNTPRTDSTTTFVALDRTPSLLSVTPSPSCQKFLSHSQPSPVATGSIPESLRRHVSNQLPPYPAITERRLDMERRRPLIVRQCVAEALGTFLFVFSGIASGASFLIHEMKDPASASNFGSMFQVGCAFGLGVAFAVVTCAPISGGHFNPAITLAFAIWQDFPWWKVPLYIVSQLTGAFLAALIVAAAYWTNIWAAYNALIAAGKPVVGAGTPAAIFCAFPGDTQLNSGYLFLIEFFVDFVIGVVIWATLDPANPFIAPAGIPFVLGSVYASMIWGFGGITLSTNLARDLGTRFVAAILFGREAFTYKNYAPIGILVNIPATLLATAFYELMMRDSLMIIGKGHSHHADGEAALFRHLRRRNMVVDDEEKACPEYLSRTTTTATTATHSTSDKWWGRQSGRYQPRTPSLFSDKPRSTKFFVGP